MAIRSPKDFWAGLMFVAVGAAAMVIALKDYRLGSAMRMGPAYFPAVLGGLLALLGLVIFLRALVLRGGPMPVFRLRPVIFILLGVLAYGYLMRPLGLALATVVLVIVGAAGGSEFRVKEVLALAAAMVVFSVLVFVKALALPFPLCPTAVDDACQRALRFGDRPPAQELERPRRKKPQAG